MLYDLARAVGHGDPLANLLRYITVRSALACLTALVFSIVMGPRLIRGLRELQGAGQPIRDDGPARHLIEKKGTPTMGGLMILAALTVSTMLWADWRNLYVWTALLVTLCYGLLGFADDYLKVTRRSHKGLSGRGKLIGQAVVGLIACAVIAWRTGGALGTGGRGAVSEGCAGPAWHLLSGVRHGGAGGREQCGEPDRRA